MISRLLLVLVILSLSAVTAVAQRPQPDGITITHGPMLGRPAPRSMGVWVRTSRPGTLRVRYGLQPDRLDERSGPLTTRLETDNTGWALLDRLQPRTKYWYEVVPDGAASGTGGSFHTLPESEAFRDAKHNPKGLFNFRFEFACGNNQGEHSSGPNLPAFKTMLGQLQDRIDFAILNGDWLYEDQREYTAAQWLTQVGRTPAQAPRLLQLAPTIAGVWENYKVYLQRGQNLSAWHRHIPSWFTFDDHEILNDVIGCGTTGLRQRRAIFRDIALQAWSDYLGWSNPTGFTQGIHFGRARLQAGSDVLTDPEADFTRLDRAQAANLHIHWGTPDAGVNDVKLDEVGGDPNAGVYEIAEVLDKQRLRVRPAAKRTGEAAYSIGRRFYFRTRLANCDFFFLDTRSHRDRHDSKRPDNPAVSMLGKQQKDWLMEEMRKSDADFFFVLSSVNLMVPHVGAGGMSAFAADKDDAWTAFLAEREELLRIWDGLERPVFVLTGDLHNSFAIRVTDRVWEFAAGPHNSANHPLGSEGGRPASGAFNSRGRPCDIRWSSFILDDVPQALRRRPVYCVVQVNNVASNPLRAGEARWVAYPRPQVVFQYHDGLTGELLYAEGVPATR